MVDLPGRLAQLASLYQQGLLPNVAYDAAVEREMAAWTDQQRVSVGLLAAGYGPTGLPSSAYSFSGATVVVGGGMAPPQQQTQQLQPRLQLEPEGPTPQQQLESLQQQQVQMQRQMQEQMAAAQAALEAAAPPAAAPPQVQFREQATRSSSSGEKKAAAPARR